MIKYLLAGLFCFSLSAVLAQTPTLSWAKRIGGSGFEYGLSTALDATGNMYTTGYFSGTVDFDPGSGIFNLTATGSKAAFVSKLDSAGNFVWAKSFGSSGASGANSIVVNSAGHVYVGGYFSGSGDFDPGIGVFNLTPVGLQDAFLIKLDSTGNFKWAKNIGGPGSDNAMSVKLDPSENIYLIGIFIGTVDFDPGPGVMNLVSAGNIDGFITKLDAAGSLIWARHQGGIAADVNYAAAIDAAGNIYTTGYFSGTADFNPGTGVFNLTATGFNDIFVSKLDAGGNFMWARSMKGTSSEIAYSIAVDDYGHVYTTGTFSDTVDFDPGADSVKLVGSGNQDVFISKLDTAGNFVWAGKIGGTDFEHSSALITDPAGNVYISGRFMDTVDFDPTNGVYNLMAAGNLDVFVLKLDSAGNLLWAKAAGGPDVETGFSIAVDRSDNVYMAGTFTDTADFDPGPGVLNLPSAGSTDIFLMKLSSVVTGGVGVGLLSASPDGFLLFPNPTTGSVTIRSAELLKSASIQLFNSTGQLLKEYKAINGRTFVLDLVEQMPGTYIIKLINGNGPISQLKLSKQ